jgi:hypothetical protein
MKKVNISIPGLKGIKGCFGMSKAASLPYLASKSDGPKDSPQGRASSKQVNCTSMV